MRRRGPTLRWLAAAAAVALALLVALGPPAVRGAPASAPRTAPVAHLRPQMVGLYVNVTFNGVLVNGHDTPGTAIVSTFANSFVTVFTWASPTVGAEITQGTLSIVFLGATVGTSSQSFSGAVPGAGPGTVTLTSNYQSDQYLFEGVYLLHASLYDYGHAAYNVSFYVWVQATDHLTLVNIVLLVIAACEIYQIAALGSARAARKELGLDAAPKPPEES